MDKPSILNKIVKQRKSRLQKEKVDIAKLKLKRSERSLVTSLLTSKTGLILECKKRSPSRGLLAESYQPDNIAKQYAPFASGISVLTEPDFFSGSLQDLVKVRESVDLPILCKDFVVDTKQIYMAREAGADVILLMLSVISDEFWLDCYQVAETLGLDIITEVNNEDEITRAIQLPAKIIGINNRNLHTLETNVAVTENLAKMIPSDRIIISESGISSHHHLIRLAPLVHGFLIGSSLMQAESISHSLRKLIFGEIKICGLTRREDADLAWQLGACFGGLIFTPRSSRCITKDQASLLCDNQPMPMVGVFMDQPMNQVAEFANDLKLSVVQLHGNESLVQIANLKSQLHSKCKIWKAISCSETLDEYPSMEQAIKLKDKWLKNGVDRLLFDTPKIVGKHQLNYQFNDHLIMMDPDILIAGGLSVNKPREIQIECDHQVAAGFDLCSSVEATPGVKDHHKLSKLFEKLKPQTRVNG